MTQSNCGYAVFLFDNAIDVLGAAVKPYLVDGEGGPRICCRGIDTAGAFVEMTVDGHDETGDAVAIEIAVPVGMVRLIVSTRGDVDFGFRLREGGVPTGLPVVGPAAPSPYAPPAAVPQTATKPG